MVVFVMRRNLETLWNDALARASMKFSNPESYGTGSKIQNR